MDLNKHREFFNPDAFNKPIHIIGCGAVGSTIAEQLARLGINKINIYDFDKVCPHNITNQMFFEQQIGQTKTSAVKAICKLINPNMQIIMHNEGWKPGMPISGYVFLAVDNIDVRKEIVKDNLLNGYIEYMFDTRMRLTDAQHFASKWTENGKEYLAKTMDFTAEEANAATPMSACGTTLSVTPTVRLICSLAVVNFINAVTKKNPVKKCVLLDAFTMDIDAFNE